MDTRFFSLYIFAQVLLTNIPFSIEMYSLLIGFAELVFTIIDFVGGSSYMEMIVVVLVGCNMVGTYQQRERDKVFGLYLARIKD